MDKTQKFVSQTLLELLHTPSLASLAPVGLPGLDQGVGWRAGSVVEFVGPTASGKTDLLLHIIVRALLPSKWPLGPVATPAMPPLIIGGQELQVYFFDLDCKFNILRLSHLMEVFVRQVAPPSYTLDGGTIQAILNNSLQRLNIFRCWDGLQLVATIQTLGINQNKDEYPKLSSDNGVSNEADNDSDLNNFSLWSTLVPSPFDGSNTTSSSSSAYSGLRLVILDSVSWSYWSDKMDSTTKTGQAFYERHMVNSLRRLMKITPTVVLAAKAALWPSPNQSAKGPKEFLSTSWSNFVTHRFSLVSVHNCISVQQIHPSTGPLLQWTITANGIINESRP